MTLQASFQVKLFIISAMGIVQLNVGILQNTPRYPFLMRGGSGVLGDYYYYY